MGGETFVGRLAACVFVASLGGGALASGYLICSEEDEKHLSLKPNKMVLVKRTSIKYMDDRGISSFSRC